jgi:hypothetical protein
VPESGTMWDRWRELYRTRGLSDAITLDGIGDENRFRGEPQRILFVLREPNRSPGMDMRDQLRKGPQHSIWFNVARWAVGFQEGFPPYAAINQRGDRLDGALRRIAAINLKKLSGRSTADLGVINAFAQQDRELLAEQIAMINPTLIIACGTFDPLLWLLGCQVDLSSPVGRSARTASGATLLGGRHPAHCPGEPSYNHLRDLHAGSLDQGAAPAPPA